MMVKIWINGDTIISLSKKTLWEKEKLLVTTVFQKQSVVDVLK